jgi:hypothetical protein
MVNHNHLDVWDFLTAFIYDREATDPYGEEEIDDFLEASSSTEITGVMLDLMLISKNVSQHFERIKRESNISFDTEEDAAKWLHAVITKMKTELDKSTK